MLKPGAWQNSWDQGVLRRELHPHCQGVGTSSKGVHVPLPAQLGLGTWCGVLVGWDQVLQGKSWGCGCLCMALQAPRHGQWLQRRVAPNATS